MELLLNTIQQTLLFVPLALGVYISYDILKITDLTVEGTFVLGAAIFARLTTLGFSQTSSVIFALLGGGAIGIAVTLMQRIAKIDSLIAGILATFMLYSVNFAIMNQPNISLLDDHILLQHLQNLGANHLTIFLAAVAFFLFAALFILLNSTFGLSLRAFGSNSTLLKKLGKNPGILLGFGLALSNMLAALCGIMTSQLNGYADIHMGLGMALTAIGAVVIGNKIVTTLIPHHHFSASLGLLGAFIGAFVYFLIMNGFLAAGINPIYLKLVIGVLLIIFLSTTRYSRVQSHGTAHSV